MVGKSIIKGRTSNNLKFVRCFSHFNKFNKASGLLGNGQKCLIYAKTRRPRGPAGLLISSKLAAFSYRFFIFMQPMNRLDSPWGNNGPNGSQLLFGFFPKCLHCSVINADKGWLRNSLGFPNGSPIPLRLWPKRSPTTCRPSFPACVNVNSIFFSFSLEVQFYINID
jgi:hypothetical protein